MVLGDAHDREDKGARLEVGRRLVRGMEEEIELHRAPKGPKWACE